MAPLRVHAAFSLVQSWVTAGAQWSRVQSNTFATQLPARLQSLRAQLNQANVRAIKQQMLLLFKAQGTVNTAALKSLARTGATTGGLFLSTAAAAALGASPHHEHPDGASPSSSTADAQYAAQQALSQDALWQYATVDSRLSAAQGTVSGAHTSHSAMTLGSNGALTRTTQSLTEDEALLLFAAAGQQRA